MIPAAVSDTLGEEANDPHHPLRAVSLHGVWNCGEAQQDQPKVVKINDSIYMAPLGANVYLVTTTSSGSAPKWLCQKPSPITTTSAPPG
jgi:hypothetical protein